MPPASSPQFQPSNHLGGDTQPSVTPNATTQPAAVAPSTSKPKKPKDDAVPDDFDDDEPDPDAGPSGHNGPPLLPLDGDEPFNPSPMPENDPQPDTQDQKEPQEEEEEEEEEEEPEEDTDETIPYGSTDTDETLDYNDLVIDDSQWCLLSQEQKLCSNTASFLVPTLIDGSPVALSSVKSSNSIGMSYSVVSERQRNWCRKTRSDIIEEYHGSNEEDKAFMTLYSMTDKFSYLAARRERKPLSKRRGNLPNSF